MHAPFKKLRLLLFLVILGHNSWANAEQIILPSAVSPLITLEGTEIEIPSLPQGFFGTIGGEPSDAWLPSNFRFEIGSLPDTALGDLDFLFQIAKPAEFRGFNGSYFVVSARHTAEARESAGIRVERKEDIVLGNIGATATIDIELVALSLQSLEPIEVTYGGSNPQFFDVFVDLDPAASQRPGSMSLERMSKGGGIFSAVLPLDLLMRFENQASSGPRASEVISFIDSIEASGAEFKAVPEPGSLSLFIVSVLGLLFGTKKWRQRG